MLHSGSTSPLAATGLYYCGVIEDKMHYLKDCSFYITERTQQHDTIQPLIQDYRNLTLPMKFISIMTNELPEFTEAVGKLILNGLLKRSEANRK